MKLVKRLKIVHWAIIGFLICTVAIVWAGTPDTKKFGLRIKDEGANHSTPPSGYMDVYVNSDTLYTINDSGTATAITAGAGDNTLDNAYDQGGAGAGKAITVDTGAIALSNTDADTAWLLTLNASPSSSAALGGLQITNGSNSSQDALEFANSGSGYDIYGSGGTWTMSAAGALTCASATITSLTATTLYNSAIASAASGNTNLTIDASGTGTITLGGTSTGLITTDNTVRLYGDTDIGDAVGDTLTISASIDGDVYIDDGTTNSPALYLKDATNETCAFVKLDNGDTTATIPADTDFEIVTGNLAVGNGSPGTAAMDGEDAYVEGDMEVDGTVTLDGAVSCNSTLALSGNTTFTMGAAEYLKLDADTTAMTGTAGALDINLKTGATNVKAIHIDLEADDTFANAYGLYIDVDDDGSGGEETVDCIYLANSAGTASTVNGVQMANTLDVGIDAVMAAAGQFAVIDATATDNTGTAGVIDLNLGTVTNGCDGINIDVDLGDTGAGVTANAIMIDLDDDTSTNAATLNGVNVTSSDLTGHSSTVVRAYYTTGCDVAFQADFGYVRIGTGSSPGVTPGDDDLYVEGTVEIDGNLYPDGDIVGDGATKLTGTVHDLYTDPNGATLTIAQSGDIIYNAGAEQYDLPEASTCHGAQYTFVVLNASNLDINPDDDDLIVAATDTAGDMLRSATVGDTVTLVCVSDSQWVVQSMYPASTDWTDAN